MLITTYNYKQLYTPKYYKRALVGILAITDLQLLGACEGADALPFACVNAATAVFHLAGDSLAHYTSTHTHSASSYTMYTHAHTSHTHTRS